MSLDHLANFVLLDVFRQQILWVETGIEGRQPRFVTHQVRHGETALVVCAKLGPVVDDLRLVVKQPSSYEGCDRDGLETLPATKNVDDRIW